MGDFEQELKQIENQWKEKYQAPEKPVVSVEPVREETVVRVDSNEERLKKRSEALKQKYLDSLEIHRKPKDLTILKAVFTFVLSNGENKGVECGDGPYRFLIDSGSLKQLLFIEYIVQRLADIITQRTKAYILEKESTEDKTVREEREEEEYAEMCDRYVTERAAIFNDIHFQSEEPVNQSSGFVNTAVKYNETSAVKSDEAEDEGEAEMIAKLRGFEDLIKENSNDRSKTVKKKPKDLKQLKKTETSESAYDEYTTEFGDKKKPLPNYEQLREEAIRQQLKIREFFTSSVKKSAEEPVTTIDEDRGDFNASGGLNQNMIFRIKETNEQIVRIFPSVDSQAQAQIRRKIFYDKLIK